MKARTLYLAGGVYAGFCIANWLIAYSAARSGSPTVLGSATLLQLNESLAGVNLLRRLVDPLALAEKQSGTVGAYVHPQAMLPNTLSH